MRLDDLHLIIDATCHFFLINN